jgi:uncharacterized membrane protein
MMGGCCGSLGWGGWSGMGLVGPILGLLFTAGVLALLGLGAVWLIRQFGRGQATKGAQRADVEPLEIARRRLAAGEISTEEFEEIRNRLRG